MIINYGEKDIPINPETSVIVKYKDHDILNCLYTDVDPDDYMVMSAYAAEYNPIAALAVAEGVEVIEDIIEVDFDEVPHLYIVNSIGRMIAACAEDIANGKY
jgi:hypothetical protein